MVEQPSLPGIDQNNRDLHDRRDGEVWAAWCHIWRPEPDLSAIESTSAVTREAFRAADGGWASLCQALVRHFPDLVSARPSKLRWEKEEMSALLELVRSRAPTDASFLAQWRVLEVLDAGNRAGRWHIPIVHIPVPLPAPHRPYFDDELFRRMVRYQGLLDAFVGQPLSVDQPVKARWGQILGSCLVQAGIYEPSLLAKVPKAVENAPAHLHWLDLDPGPGNGARSGVRRHYLDPFTRLLLARMRYDRSLPPVQAERWNSRKVYSCIKAYTLAVGLADGSLPANLKALRDLVRARHALTVPPYLIGWADGHYRCTAVPAHSVERLFTALPDIPTGPRPTIAESNASPATPAHGQEHEVGGQEDDSKDWIAASALPSVTKLGSLIRAGTADTDDSLLAFRNANDGQVPPAVLRLADWADRWLFAAGAGRRPLAARTAYDRFNAIAERLVGQLAMDDPATLTSPDDFIEIYTTALDDTASDGARRRVAQGLQSFHAFLHHEHGVPDLKASGVFSIRGRTPHAVDANVIDPEAFEWAIAWMEWTLRDEPDVAEIAVLIASLGYYAGLRRSEAEGLRVGDIDGEPSWDLVVQPNSDRRLKSVSAHRRIPLGVLLPPQRLDRLKSWWRRRTEDIDDRARGEWPLFRVAQSSGSTTPFNQHATTRAFECIRDALYRATSDSELRYHHLRHSMANRLLLSLWAYEQPGSNPLPQWAQALLHHDPASLRKRLLGHAPVQRRSLRLISALMGHSGTDITMTHYVHVADVLFAHALRRRPGPVSDAALAKLGGTSVERVRRQRSKAATAEADYIDHLADQLISTSDRLAAREPVTTRRLAEPTGIYERCVEMTRWVCDAAAGLENTHEFSPPWSQEQIDSWIARLAELPWHHRKPRYGSLLDAIYDPPRTRQDVRIGTQTLEWLHRLAPAQRHRIVQQYRTGLLASHPLDVVYASVSGFRNWVELLRQLGFTKMVDFYHVPNSWGAAEGSERQLRYWRERTGEHIIRVPMRELPALSRRQLSSRGSVLTLHRRDASPESHYWAYGLTWAFTATSLLEGV